MVGCSCSLGIVIFSDGNTVMIDVPEEGSKNGAKRVLKPASAAQIRSYLQGGHNGHDLIPDYALISSMALSRSVPPVALESMKDMRRAGMAMESIYRSIHVCP